MEVLPCPVNVNFNNTRGTVFVFFLFYSLIVVKTNRRRHFASLSVALTVSRLTYADNSRWQPIEIASADFPDQLTFHGINE